MQRIPFPYKIVVALVVGGVAAVMLTRDGTPPLSAETFEAARAKWQESGISTYEVLVHKKLDGRPLERVRTVVEQGEVRAFYINDGKVDAIRDSYTVEGLFDIVERELEMASSPQKEPGQPAEVMLRATFDPTTGLPTVFKRLASDRKSVFLMVRELSVPKRGVIFRSES